MDKQTGAEESVDRMCGEDQRREYTIPNLYTRIIHLAVHSLHTSPNKYSVHWEAQGLLLPDTLQFILEGRPLAMQISPNPSLNCLFRYSRNILSRVVTIK